MMNLAAPFICRDFSNQVNDLLPHIDILFSNDAEAKEFADAMNFGGKDIEEVALNICKRAKVSKPNKSS
jgi:adenosine kinase